MIDGGGRCEPFRNHNLLADDKNDQDFWQQGMAG
jgi:hypothetical protein